MPTTLKIKLFACAAIVFTCASCAKKTTTGWDYNEYRWEYTTAAKTQLPKSIKKSLENFVCIEGGSYTAGQIQGTDSFTDIIAEQRITLSDFYLDKYETTVEDYMMFYRETEDPALKPDSISILTDFPYSYGDPMVQVYFWHPKYYKYPICGVRLHQAKRYCERKTEKINAELKAKGEENIKITFRLPTTYELEYAMINNAENYPFNLRNLINTCNTGEVRDKNDIALKYYAEDGYMWQAPVKSYAPNEAGIYNLHGNVAEWTLSSLAETYTVDTSFSHNFSLGTKNEYVTPEDTAFIVPGKNAQKIFADTSYYITKGGSFVHGLYYLQPGAFIPVKSDEQHAWLGFRMVMVITPKTKE